MNTMESTKVLANNKIFKILQLLGLYSFAKKKMSRIIYQLVILSIVTLNYLTYFIFTMYNQGVDISSLTGVFGIVECKLS